MLLYIFQTRRIKILDTGFRVNYTYTYIFLQLTNLFVTCLAYIFIEYYMYYTACYVQYTI